MMTVKRSLSVTLCTLGLLGLVACTHQVYSPEQLIKDAQYWQRTSTTSALYMQGPKAHQTLNRDIARCVTEIKELQRLGYVRQNVPADVVGGQVDPASPQGELAEWESPTREGYLYAEHTEYHDFETCMMNKGWERIKTVPYDVARESRLSFLESLGITDIKSPEEQEKAPAPKKDDDWTSLND